MDGVGTSAWDGGSSEYVVAWPNGERILDDVEDGVATLEGPWLNVSEADALDEHVDSSLVSASILASSATALDMHDSLLDALSRLQEERARNERLQRQVDCARALAELPNTGKPLASATVISRAWRRRAARWDVRARESQARTLIQAAARAWCRRRAHAAATLRRGFRTYLLSILPRQTKTRLRREVMRQRAEVDRARAQVATKDAALDRHAATVARWTQMRGQLRASEAEWHMRARSAFVQRCHTLLAVGRTPKAAGNERGAREVGGAPGAEAGGSLSGAEAEEEEEAAWSALARMVARLHELEGLHADGRPTQPVLEVTQSERAPPIADRHCHHDGDSGSKTEAICATASPPEGCAGSGAERSSESSPEPSAKRLAAKVAELEELATRLAVERTDLAAQLAEQASAARRVEDKASQLVLAKEAAEELASRLLAENMHLGGDGAAAARLAAAKAWREGGAAAERCAALSARCSEEGCGGSGCDHPTASLRLAGCHAEGPWQPSAWPAAATSASASCLWGSLSSLGAAGLGGPSRVGGDDADAPNALPASPSRSTAICQDEQYGQPVHSAAMDRGRG